MQLSYMKNLCLRIRQTEDKTTEFENGENIFRKNVLKNGTILDTICNYAFKTRAYGPYASQTVPVHLPKEN